MLEKKRTEPLKRSSRRQSMRYRVIEIHSKLGVRPILQVKKLIGKDIGGRTLTTKFNMDEAARNMLGFRRL